MIIKSLEHYPHDIELIWLSGYYHDSIKGYTLKLRFRDTITGEAFAEELPFSLLPILMPGFVVSQGVVQDARRTGQQQQVILDSLAEAEEVGVMDVVSRRLYDMTGHRGGEQRILRYRSGYRTILIPTIELIRFLYLHDRVLAEALLEPAGLVELAVTPPPGHYGGIEIDFTEKLPRKVLTPEFIREFSWLAVHPDGRRTWDSVQRRSLGKRFLSLAPPPVRDCRLVFRGVGHGGTWLVLEITSLSGRTLPAKAINWAHPSECERNRVVGGDGPGKARSNGPHGESRPIHEREHMIENGKGQREGVNQDVMPLGGRRGCFANEAELNKILRPRRVFNFEGEIQRKTRSDAGQPIDPDLPPKIIRKTVSVEAPAPSEGLPPVDFNMLDEAGLDDIGDLSLLKQVLLRIEKACPDLTLTIRVVFLKPGKAISSCGLKRRTCLIGLFTSRLRPPMIVLDVDHTGLTGGLAGLLLHYDRPYPMKDVARHLEMLLTALIDRYGHWDNETEKRLPTGVTVRRMPKLVRMKERASDDQYIQVWAEKIINLLFNSK
jgi:hypothetical protein